MRSQLALSVCLVICLFVLSACGPDVSTQEPKVTASSAYVRFLKDVSVRDHAINHYNFAANAKFMKRGTFEPGIGLYCGPYTINDNVMRQGCFGFGKNVIVIGPGAGFKEVKRTMPQGSFKFFGNP